MLLKNKLDDLYKKNCTKEFILYDPVQFPRRFKKREDIEIAALLSATIAWGRRDMIIRSAEKMLALMKQKPFDFIMSGEYKKLKNNNIHRTFFESDLKYFCRALEYCYAKYNNIEKMFASCADVWEGIAFFREEAAKANKSAYSRHVSNPGKENGSACKKLHLALRWLVRKDAVDLGLWKNIKQSSLFIPLDVHVSRAARNTGLLERKSNDKKAVIELTQNLRQFCPEDPVKYDFALFNTY